MANDILKGNWKQLTGAMKQKWGELTDDELVEIAGQRDKLAGKLQEKYGYTKIQAEQAIDEFLRKSGSDSVRM